MKVLLSSLPSIGIRNSYSLGLRYLASALYQAGIDVTVFEATIDLCSIKQVIIQNYDIVGLSLQSQASFNIFIETINDIKRISKDIFIIVGGHYATINYKEIINYVDYVLLGDGTISLVDLIKAIEQKKDCSNIEGIVYKKNNNIYFSFPKKSNLLNINPYIYSANKGDIYIKNEAIQLVASLGCPNNCTFCSIPAYKRATKHSQQVVFLPELVVKNIKYVIEKLNSYTFNFLDDNFFFGSKKMILEFCDILKKEEINIKWSAELRPEILFQCSDVLISSGLKYVRIGLENVSPSIQKRFKKNIDPEQVYELIKYLEKKQIFVKVYFILFDALCYCQDLILNINFMLLTGNCTFYNLVSRLIIYDFTEYDNKVKFKKASSIYGYDFYYKIIDKIYKDFLNVFSYAKYYDDIYDRIISYKNLEYLTKEDIKKIFYSKRKISNFLGKIALDIINARINNTTINFYKYKKNIKWIIDNESNYIYHFFYRI